MEKKTSAMENTGNAGHSARFAVLRARYGRGGCTKGQLLRFVGYGVLTPEEYHEITGEDCSLQDS